MGYHSIICDSLLFYHNSFNNLIQRTTMKANKNIEMVAKNCAIRDIKSSYNDEGITEFVIDFNLMKDFAEFQITFQELN